MLFAAIFKPADVTLQESSEVTQQPVSTAVSVLGDMAATSAAPVLIAMSPSVAGVLLQAIPDATSTAIFAAMSASAVTALKLATTLAGLNRGAPYTATTHLTQSLEIPNPLHLHVSMTTGDVAPMATNILVMGPVDACGGSLRLFYQASGVCPPSVLSTHCLTAWLICPLNGQLQ